MADTKDNRVVGIDPDDEQVFQRLAEAQEQYEWYLAVTQSTAVFVPMESPIVPPSPDVPLSLTIWRQK